MSYEISISFLSRHQRIVSKGLPTFLLKEQRQLKGNKGL